MPLQVDDTDMERGAKTQHLCSYGNTASNFEAGKTDIRPLCSQGPAVNRWRDYRRLFSLGFRSRSLFCEDFLLGK